MDFIEITAFQVGAARLVISFSRADNETKRNLLDSYTAIVREYEEALYHSREQEQNQGLDEVELDQYLDDPRHGQAEPLNRGDF
jgi:hypothetical protein